MADARASYIGWMTDQYTDIILTVCFTIAGSSENVL